MAILTLRLVKGSPLTNSEVDNNFSNINNEVGIVNGNIGVLTNLTTITKANLVSAVNELRANALALANTLPIQIVTSGNTATVSHQNSGAVAATYGNTRIIPIVTVNATGHVTSIANVNVMVPNASIVGNIISSQIQPTGVTAATYGNTTFIPSFTVDQQGRITSVANVAVSGTPTLNVVTGTTQAAVASNHYVLTNVAATTVTLPASPAAGDQVWVTVGNGLTTNEVARNGSNIQSLAENLTLNATYAAVQMRYINLTIGWTFI
jgi:hypothetical protein